MRKTISKAAIILSLALLFAGCSKKTTAPASYGSKDSVQNRGPQNRLGGPPQFAQLLQEMDSNKDGKLAKSEVKGPLQNDFAKVDQDHDGYISKKEFDAAPKGNRPGRNK